MIPPSSVTALNLVMGCQQRHALKSASFHYISFFNKPISHLILELEVRHPVVGQFTGPPVWQHHLQPAGVLLVAKGQAGAGKLCKRGKKVEVILDAPTGVSVASLLWSKVCLPLQGCAVQHPDEMNAFFASALAPHHWYKNSIYIKFEFSHNIF